MLFHVHQSVIEVALSSKEPQITFSLFRYNKGKERFKKRYELAYSTESDGCVWDLRNRGKVEREGDSRGCSARLFDVFSYSLFSLCRSIVVTVLQQGESNQCRLVHLDFENKSAPTLLCFECNRPQDLVVLDGPAVSSRSETITVLSSSFAMTPKPSRPFSSFLLYSISWVLLSSVTDRSDDAFWSVQDGLDETRILKPRTQFPDAVLHFALPLRAHQFYLVFSSAAQTFVALYASSLLSVLLSLPESVRSVRAVPCYGPAAYLVGFASEWIVLRNGAVHAHISSTDSVFCDDFLNTGTPQFLLLSSASPYAYRLLSQDQRVLLEDALHAHQHKRPHGETSVCRSVFMAGLNAKRFALEEGNEELKKECRVLKEFGEERGGVDESFFVPWIGGGEAGGGEAKEWVMEYVVRSVWREDAVEVWVESDVKEKESDAKEKESDAKEKENLFAIMEYEEGVVACFQHPAHFVVERKMKASFSLLLFSWKEDVRFLGRYRIPKQPINASRVHCVVDPRREPRCTQQWIQEMANGESMLLSPRIQITTLPVSYWDGMEVERMLHQLDSSSTAHLDVLTFPLMEKCLQDLRDAILQEVAFCREELRNMKKATQMRKEGLVLRLRTEALCLKVLSLIGGVDSLTWWAEWLRFPLYSTHALSTTPYSARRAHLKATTRCQNKHTIVHMYRVKIHSTHRWRVHYSSSGGT